MLKVILVVVALALGSGQLGAQCVILLPNPITGLQDLVSCPGAGSGDVTGGDTLLTAGSIPYVSGSGAVTQDAGQLHWDAANNRLGIGTNAPEGALTVTASSGQGVITVAGADGSGGLIRISQGAAVANGTIDLGVKSSKAGLFRSGASDAFAYYSTSTGDTVLDNVFGGSSLVRLNYGGSTKAVISSSSVGIGPSNTSPTGTLHVYDATATTGVTDVRIVAGAGQATVPTPLTRWYASDGSTVLASVSNLGVLTAAAYRLEESDSNPTCSSGDYFVFADLSETKLKKCQNGTATDLDTAGAITAGPSGAITVTGGEVDVDTAFVCLKTGTCAPTGSQDFSGASTTKSMKTGTATPGTCSVGEFFFDTDATAGQNVYACTSTNTWTLQGGSSPTQSTALVRGVMDAPLLVNGSQFAFTADRIYCGNFYADRNMTVGHMVAWAPIGPGAGDLRFGIYDSSGNLLVQSGAPTVSGNTVNVALSQSMTAGTTYSLCFATDDASLRFTKVFQGQGEEALYNLNESNFFYCANSMSGTTLAATCGAKTAINSGGAPWIGIAK